MSITPGTSRRISSTPQKQPPASTATSNCCAPVVTGRVVSFFSFMSRVPRYSSLSGKNLKGLLHAAVGGGGGLLRAAPLLTRAQVGRVPVPPVMLGVRLLEAVVALRRLAEEFRERRDVRGSCPRRLPLAAGEPRRDLLEQPAVPVRVLERGEREVGTAFGVAPADARVLQGVVEGAAGVVEDLAHVNAAGDEVGAGGVEVFYGEDEAVGRARLGRRDPLAEDDRGSRVVRRHLHGAVGVARRDVDVEPPAEIFVERLGAVYVGNAEQHDFELHVGLCLFLSGHLCALLCETCPCPSSMRAHSAGTTSGFPFSTTYVASSAPLPLPTFFTAWITPAGMNRTSPALSVTGGRPSTLYSSEPSMA